MELFYAWSAAFASGFTPLVIKASSKNLIKNAWLFNILWIAFSIPFVTAFALIQGAGMPSHWLPLIYLGASYAAFYIFYTSALYRIDVSVIAPLFSLRTLFAVIIGVIFLGEHLSLSGYGLVGLIILATPFAAFHEDMKLRAFFERPILKAIFAMFILALVGYFTNRAVEANGYATTLFWEDILILIFLLPTLFFAQLSKQKFTSQSLLPFLLIGVFDFIYIAATTAAYAANLSLSSVIVSLPLSMFFAVALSLRYGDMLERHTWRIYFVRFSAAAVMVTAAIFLSFIR